MSSHPIIVRIQADMAARQVLLGDGGKPDGDTGGRWAVAWADAGVERAHTLGASRGRLELVLPVQCVGQSTESARYVAAVLADALFALAGVDIDGRRLRKPEQLTARPVVRDDDVKPPLFSQAVEWRLVTTPTT